MCSSSQRLLRLLISERPACAWQRNGAVYCRCRFSRHRSVRWAMASKCRAGVGEGLGARALWGEVGAGWGRFRLARGQASASKKLPGGDFAGCTVISMSRLSRLR